MDIKTALKMPYVRAGSTIVDTLLLTIGTILVMISAAVSIALAFLNVRIDSTVELMARITLIIISLLLTVRVIGDFARMLEELSGIVAPKGVFTKGVKMSVALFAYYIPYQASVYIPGVIGQTITSGYILILLVSLPAIMMNTVKEGIGGAFKVNEWLALMFSKEYWMSVVISVPIVMMYSLLAYAVGALTVVVSATETQFYGLTGLYYLVYVFCFVSAAKTVLAVFSPGHPRVLNESAEKSTKTTA
jgi:hypothetical protein